MKTNFQEEMAEENMRRKWLEREEETQHYSAEWNFNKGINSVTCHKEFQEDW